MKSFGELLIRKPVRRILYSARPEVCMDIARWALERELPVTELYPPVIDEIRPCIGDDAWAKDEFAAHRAELERPQSLVAIEGASIRDSVGFVELPDGRICYEGNWWLPYFQDHPAYKRRFSLKGRRLSGDVCSLLSLWAPEFYHWFHDVLTRLEMTLPHLPPDTKFLINENPKAWQLDSLAAYGIGPAKLETQPCGVYTRVERLWFATPVGHTTFGSGKIVRKVAERLQRHFKTNYDGDKPMPIYISRRKAACRRVVNESEIEPAFREYRFKTVICEDITLAEQVKLFSNASAIAGPHGAGLINMIYMKANNAKIMELTAEKKTVPCYSILARQLGFCFRRPLGISLANGDSKDMRIEPEHLRVELSHL